MKTFNERHLKHLLDYDPDMVISKEGVDFRRKFRPLLTGVIALTNPLRLIVEKKEYKKNESNRPIIYVCCHGFKADLQNVIPTIKDGGYILFGNIDLFYHTLDGFMAWLFGVLLVNRYDRKSQKVAKSKMNKAIEYGDNIIIFPEATWNLSENKLLEPFHWGFYDVALENNSLIVPVVTQKVGRKCYSRELTPIDIQNLNFRDEQEYNEFIEQQYKAIHRYCEYAVNICCIDNYYKRYSEFLSVTEIVLQVDKNCRELIAREHSQTEIDRFTEETGKILNQIKQIKTEDTIEDEHIVELLSLVKHAIFRLVQVKKEAVVSRISDIIATEKYEMIMAHPNDEEDKKRVGYHKEKMRDENGSIYYQIQHYDGLYESWDKYINDIIRGTRFFYLEDEKTTVYKDRLL